MEEYYLDKWGNTMVLTTGQSGRKIMYNEDYNISGYVYVDGHGNPVTLSSGFSIVRYSDFDKSGNYRKERYYDKYDNPVVISLGYAGIDYLRDENGKIECYVYVDVLGNATNNKSGYAYHKIVYDEKGEIIKQILLNVDGEEIDGK